MITTIHLAAYRRCTGQQGTYISRWQYALSLFQYAEMPLIAANSPFPCECTSCAAPGGDQFAPEDDAYCSGGDLRPCLACSASLSLLPFSFSRQMFLGWCDLLVSSTAPLASSLFPIPHLRRRHNAKYTQVYCSNKQNRNIPQSYSALKTAPKRGVSPLRGPERGEKGGLESSKTTWRL